MGPVKFIYGSPNDYFHDDASTSTLFVVFAKYHEARSPRIHQVQQWLCKTTGNAEHLRIVYDYFHYGRVPLLPLPMT